MTDKSSRFAQFFTGRSIAGWLAFVMISPYMMIMLGLLFIEVPEENKTILDSYREVLTVWVTAVIGYYYGSSVESKANTDAMAARMSFSENEDAPQDEVPNVIKDYLKTEQNGA